MARGRASCSRASACSDDCLKEAESFVGLGFAPVASWTYWFGGSVPYRLWQTAFGEHRG